MIQESNRTLALTPTYFNRNVFSVVDELPELPNDTNLFAGARIYLCGQF